MMLMSNLGITGTIAIDENGNWNPAFSVWGYNQQDTPTVFLTVAITNSIPGQSQYVIAYIYKLLY